MSDVVNGRERIVGFLKALVDSQLSWNTKHAVICWAFISLVISEAEYKELWEVLVTQ